VANNSQSSGLMERRVEDHPDDVARHEIVLRPSKGWIPVNWGELYATRELLFTLITRDLKVRYRQTVLGIAWAVLQPFITMIVFSLVFGRLIQGANTTDIPYPLFVYAGLVPWTFFLSKIYFPRAYVPASTIGAAFVDMMIALVLFALIMPFYGAAPSWQIVFLPAILGMLFLATLGIGLWTSALVIMFRDIRYLITFALQILLYLSPVIYADTYFPARLRPEPGVRPDQRLPGVDPRGPVGPPAGGHLHGLVPGHVRVRDVLLPPDRAPLRRHRLTSSPRPDRSSSARCPRIHPTF
jgi:lipopolysaccharide transport system permease protein